MTRLADRSVFEWLAVLGRSAVLAVFVAAWCLFWGLIVRLHVLQADYLSAAIVILVFIAPALGLLGAAFGLRPDLDRSRLAGYVRQ